MFFSGLLLFGRLPVKNDNYLSGFRPRHEKLPGELTIKYDFVIDGMTEIIRDRLRCVSTIIAAQSGIHRVIRRMLTQAYYALI